MQVCCWTRGKRLPCRGRLDAEARRTPSAFFSTQYHAREIESNHIKLTSIVSVCVPFLPYLSLLIFYSILRSFLNTNQIQIQIQYQYQSIPIPMSSDFFFLPPKRRNLAWSLADHPRTIVLNLNFCLRPNVASASLSLSFDLSLPPKGVCCEVCPRESLCHLHCIN